MTIIQFDGQRRRKISPPTSHQQSEDASQAANPKAPSSLPKTRSLTSVHLPLNLDGVFVEFTRSRLLQGWNAANIVLPAHVDRRLVLKTFLALSTTFFGMEHNEKSVIYQGLQRYGHALEDIHRALEDPSRCVSFDLLESLTVLLLFEVCQLAQVTRIAHFYGISS